MFYKIGKDGKPEIDVLYYPDPGPMPPLIEPKIKKRPGADKEKEKKN